MGNQNVVSIISFLLEAVLEYRRAVSAFNRNNTSIGRERLSGFMRRSSQPLISILFSLKLTILAKALREALVAIEVAVREDDSNGWCSAFDEHQMFLAELVLVLKSIRAHPPLIEEYCGDAVGVSMDRQAPRGDTTNDVEISHSGLIIDEGAGTVSYKGKTVDTGKTIPFGLLVAANEKFNTVVPNQDTYHLWGKAKPEPGARRRNVSSVNTEILKPLGAPLELRSKRNTGIILQPITSDK